MSSPTSLSMVPTPPPSSNAIPMPMMTAEEVREGGSDYHPLPTGTAADDEQAVADFVGPSTAVKDLFSLPYTSQDQVVSVAIHNVEGTLIFDRDPQPESQKRPSPLVKKKKRPLPGKGSTYDLDEATSGHISSSQEVSQALVALSCLEPPLAAAPNNKTKSDSLGVLNSFLEAVETQKRRASQTGFEAELKKVGPSIAQENHERHNIELGLPRPDHYVHQHIPPTPEPREYLSWKFHDMNLWVGSDALILREKDEKTNTQVSLTLRVEDAQKMQALVKRHEHAVQTGTFKPDHQLSHMQQRGKPSYACAVIRSKQASQRIEPSPDITNKPGGVGGASSSSSCCFSAPNLDEVRLQTCIVPSPAIPVGGLLDTDAATLIPPPSGDQSTQHLQTDERATMVSPVSTVLDAYLDNIMANVPQLALCLREKGFVQSVKLLETESIPSAFLHPSTMDTSKPFDVRTEETEKVFSPRVMEMNATALLRFLKQNCSKDNATYLLRRELGQTNVNLYDISSISAMKQKKWIWWLAMMSCRFAHRLRNIGVHKCDPAVRRAFRNRERGLLQNALDLLEALSDMDGTAHECLAAGIRENLADTFLRGEEDPGAVVVPKDSSGDSRENTPASPEPATSKSTSQQPYATLTVDALNKAYDHLSQGIKHLFPHFEKKINGGKGASDSIQKPDVVSIDGNSSDDSDEEADGSAPSGDLEVIATATQLFGLHEKIVNVSLRLAEIHLRNYYSSSAMQALRSAARRIANSLLILKTASEADSNKEPKKEWLRHLQLQYVWLWEHCGHFARSFAGDALWRDRGHAAADDILIVLQDAESAFTASNYGCAGLASCEGMGIFFDPNPLSTKTGNSVHLFSLSGIVGSKRVHDKHKDSDEHNNPGMEEARRILDSEQKFLKREERKAIIAACLAYQRSIHAFEELEGIDGSAHIAKTDDATFLALLKQRLGDACNEAGKILMNELRLQLSKQKDDSAPSEQAARALLSSAEFWFEQSLHAFQQSGDLKNLVLLRCNLCQCFKLRANALFSANETLNYSTHAENCLQEAANQLEAAHECLGERGTNPNLWDMVSAELAATFLVLGVRRRQSLIGSGNTPLILQSFRLSPGQERSIVDPMERALAIYQSNGNMHQAAAAHYQLALFFSKVWTCQRDEAKTRERLGAAFKHYNVAHGYFSQAFYGNELTLCLVCLDLSNLYSSVQGEEGNVKALLCCLDTVKAVGFAVADENIRTARPDDWYVQMDTVAASVEDRVFKSLRNLVKLFDDGETQIPYKDIYRASLRAKMTAPKPKLSQSRELTLERLSAFHAILKATDDALANVGLK